MIVVNKKINLSQLDKEYNSQGLYLYVDEEGQTIVSLTENNNGNEKDLKKAIDQHVAIDDAEVKQAQRQVIADRLGLTADELKLLLG
jgi:hypothetical protein